MASASVACRPIRSFFDLGPSLPDVETEAATQGREARDVRDLDEMLRVFREQVEPVYGRSSRLVRDRIKKDVAQGFERMDRNTPAVTERHDD
jgi:hypothetical protein